MTGARGDALAGLGVVVIGRNEGARLQRCLRSIDMAAIPCVYVDSGSTDQSIINATELGATVVELDMAKPFTAARARNAGMRRLLSTNSHCKFIQFVDGDCELVEGWLSTAAVFLNSHPDHVAVAGRLRERFPEQSIFNRMCDQEWDTAIGSARSVGGIALFRSSALSEANGFREDLIAGEEPELCVRLRQAGWKIWRHEHDMAWHDAAMTRWSQWWRRTVRSGHAFAQGAAIHGSAPERHFVAEVRRALLWGCVLPVMAILATLVSTAGAVSWLIYLLQAARLGARAWRGKRPSPWLYGAMLVAGRFPEAVGVLKYWAGRWSGKQSGIIEYK